MKETRDTFLPAPPAEPLPASLALLRQARFALRDEFQVKITRALEPLGDGQIWQRPNEASNSIGNLILHLCGNARQWIVAGISGAEDFRERNAEFAAREGIDRITLLALLAGTLAEVDDVLAALEIEVQLDASDAALQRLCTPQRIPQTVLDAICHVVQHFGYHTGQIVYIAKMLAEGRVAFYDDRFLAGEK
ncbi:MAG: DUF1572 family protein [Blastocatellia bacterium]